jgi:hypothetical protein
MKRHIAFAQFCAVRVDNLLFAIFLAFCTLGLSIFGSAQEPDITTFDAPNSGTGANQGTAAYAINLFGAIVGNVTDNNYNTHGFCDCQ